MTGCGHCADEREPGAGDPGFRRVLWIALAVNSTMFVVEVGASLPARSLSLQADALDFFGDAATYAVTLLVLGMGPVARSKAGLTKGAGMGLFGLWVLGNAVYRAFAGAAPDPFIIGPVALLALGANVAVAAMLYRHRSGDSNRSSVWLCCRNDAIGNVAVFGAAAAVYLTGAGWPDLAVAAAIAGLNLVASRRVVRQAIAELRAPHGSIVGVT